jgi:exopolysaccharide biosynthesis predicted pyruvyltransferase EpsI
MQEGVKGRRMSRVQDVDLFTLLRKIRFEIDKLSKSASDYKSGLCRVDAEQLAVVDRLNGEILEVLLKLDKD